MSVFGAPLLLNILRGYPELPAPLTPKEWAKLAVNFKFVGTSLSYKDIEFEKKEEIAHGSYGQVCLFKGGRRSVAVKLFKNMSYKENDREVENVNLMNKIDRTDPSDIASSRMAAFSIENENGTPCIISPVYLVYKKTKKTLLEALLILQAYFRDAHEIHQKYNLIGFDSSANNLLISCTPTKQIVHACDYGGFSKAGRKCLSTYPSPWLPFDDNDSHSQVVCEEICVHTMFATFLFFMQHKQEKYLWHSQITADGGVQRAQNVLKNISKDFPQGPIRDMVRYCAVPDRANPPTMSCFANFIDLAVQAVIP